MTEPQKDTIYVDVDDEITNIIEKVKDSNHKIVALVLPKRATVLQSAVNMKLLKRSADSAKKKLVLITSENGLLPLAGAVGLHVAKNLQSKPAIPAGPDAEDEIPEALVHEEELEPDEEPELDDSKSVGELSGDEAPVEDNKADKADDVKKAAPLAAEETIQMDDDEPAEKASKKGKKGKKDKKLKVPNFERFRKWLILGGIGLLILLIGGYFAIGKMPKAKITISTDSSDVTANVTVTANTTNKTFDAASKTVPGQKATTKKTDSQSVAATGQKNNGNKATGNVTMTAKNCDGLSVPPAVASGTGLTANGQTYITQSQTTFTFDKIQGGCINYKASSTPITAQNGGEAYNTGNTSFTVAGRSDVSASGNANGGTDDMVKVVSQGDVDGAKQKMTTTTSSDAAKAELKASLEKDGFFAIDSSFVADPAVVASSPAVGAQADNVTVTSSTTYTMVGVNKDNLSTVLDEAIKGQIDSSKQAVQNNGLDTATFTVTGKDNPQIAVQTTATIGPNLDYDAIKREVAGKKKNETKEIISSRPSIKSVDVNYSPFWVVKTPSNPNKVTIVFEKANN